MSIQKLASMILIALAIVSVLSSDKTDAATLYCVCADGDLADPQCWSAAPDGPGGAGVPSEVTDCVISVSGFLSSSASELHCRDIDISEFAGLIALPSNGLYIHGNATLGNHFAVVASGFIHLVGGGVLEANDYNDLNGIIEVRAVSRYYLSEAWIGPQAKLRLSGGVFSNNGYTVELNDIEDGGPDTAATLEMSSDFRIHHSMWFGNGGNITTVWGTSHVWMLDGSILGPHARRLYDITVEGRVGLGAIAEAHSLEYLPGSSVRHIPGFADYHMQKFICHGTADNQIEINGDSAFLFSVDEQVHCTHTTLTNVRCAGTVPCIADTGSIDRGGNDQWCIEEVCPLETYTPTPTLKPVATATPTATVNPTAPECLSDEVLVRFRTNKGGAILLGKDKLCRRRCDICVPDGAAGDLMAMPDLGYEFGWWVGRPCPAEFKKSNPCPVVISLTTNGKIRRVQHLTAIFRRAR